MMVYVIYTGQTEQEARNKAIEGIRKFDIVQQAHLYSVYQDKNGEWKAVIQHWGTD